MHSYHLLYYYMVAAERNNLCQTERKIKLQQGTLEKLKYWKEKILKVRKSQNIEIERKK